MRSIANKRHFHRGFSLVEVMVALMVLSIGMLGIAALYVESLRAGRTAIYRTQAVNLASDMAERIRANTDAGAAYAGAAANVGCNDGPALAVECTPDQMAAQDLFDWQQIAQALLPNGNAQLQFVAGGAGVADTYTITLTWVEIDQANPVSYVMTVQI
jgi:type IV pilus assembly protein PilV